MWRHFIQMQSTSGARSKCSPLLLLSAAQVHSSVLPPHPIMVGLSSSWDWLSSKFNSIHLSLAIMEEGWGSALSPSKGKG